MVLRAEDPGVHGHHRPELDYGLSDFDVKSHFVSNFVYELPVGRGKRLTSAAPIVQWML